VRVSGFDLKNRGYVITIILILDGVSSPLTERLQLGVLTFPSNALVTLSETQSPRCTKYLVIMKYKSRYPLEASKVNPQATSRIVLGGPRGP
jgi:hypothetical protein